MPDAWETWIASTEDTWSEDPWDRWLGKLENIVLWVLGLGALAMFVVGMLMLVQEQLAGTGPT